MKKMKRAREENNMDNDWILILVERERVGINKFKIKVRSLNAMR